LQHSRGSDQKIQTLLRCFRTQVIGLFASTICNGKSQSLDVAFSAIAKVMLEKSTHCERVVTVIDEYFLAGFANFSIEPADVSASLKQRCQPKSRTPKALPSIECNAGNFRPVTTGARRFQRSTQIGTRRVTIVAASSRFSAAINRGFITKILWGPRTRGFGLDRHHFAFARGQHLSANTLK